MPATFSRRTILQLTALAPALRPLVAKMSAPERNSTVALVTGDSRRKNIAQALAAIDDQVRPGLKAAAYAAAVAFNRNLLNDNEELLLDLRPHWIFLTPAVLALRAIEDRRAVPA